MDTRTIKRRYGDLLTSNDICELFGVCKDTVRRWSRAGKLQGVMVGRGYVYAAEEVARFSREGTRPGV